MQDALGRITGLSKSELVALHSRIAVGASGMRSHAPKVENHAMDAAPSQALSLNVCPNLTWPGGLSGMGEDIEGNFEGFELVARLHGHTVDEYAIGCDFITPTVQSRCWS